ncbi:MAG: helix-turn-helix domain-containing protein, partial [Planctomycetales bacterium]|nr:helix-turn-helix domain-containing protein [Planctomycetales bacterium]
GQFTVPAGEEIWQLLLVIALNKVRRLGRFHQQQQRSVDRSNSQVELESVSRFENESELSILQLVIDESLEHLPGKQRQIVELRIQGYSTTEISKQVGRCKRTVERTLRQFRNEIADYLDNNGNSNS